MAETKMTAEEAQQAKEQARKFLAHMERDEQAEEDARIVWIENKSGVRDVCRYGHYRTYMRKHGARLLTPDEVEEQEEKVRQSAARRAQEAARRREDSLEALSMDELRERLAALEKKGKKS